MCLWPSSALWAALGGPPRPLPSCAMALCWCAPCHLITIPVGPDSFTELLSSALLSPLPTMVQSCADCQEVASDSLQCCCPVSCVD